jgi:alpha/beta superfamily hydrolase
MIAFVEERGFFSNRRGRRLYYAFHGSPAVTTLWVFCNPFLEEKTFAHPVYVHFARHLAGLGNAVLRFDYEGDGDSEGETVDASLGHWRDDVEDALAFATARAKPSEVVLFGLRLGAAAAVLAAERCGIR